MINGYKISRVIIDTEIEECLNVKDIMREIKGETDGIGEKLIETLITSIGNSISSDIGGCRVINQKINDFAYNREAYEDNSKMKKFKNTKFKESKSINNDYRDSSELLKTKKEAKLKYPDNWTKHSAETDHIIPLKNIFDSLNKNGAILDKDIKEIANIEENFALIDKNLNASKKEMLNSQYTEKNKRLDNKTKKNMIKLEGQAKKNIDKSINKKVLSNIYNEKEVRENICIEMKENSKSITKDISKRLIQDIIIEFSGALIYEVKHIVNSKEDYKITDIIKRIANHMWGYIEKEKVSKGIDVATAIIKGLIDTLVSYFSKAIKMIWKVIRTSINDIIKAIKILVKPSDEISKAKAKDLALKMLSATIVNILGIYLNDAISKILFIGEYSNVISGICVGVVSVLVVAGLDKIDLFSTKMEDVEKRIDEIYTARRNEIVGSLIRLEEEEQLKKYQFELSTSWINNEITKSLESKDYTRLNDAIIELGSLFDIKLKYQSKEEFIDYIRGDRTLVLS